MPKCPHPFKPPSPKPNSDLLEQGPGDSELPRIHLRLSAYMPFLASWLCWLDIAGGAVARELGARCSKLQQRVVCPREFGVKKSIGCATLFRGKPQQKSTPFGAPPTRPSENVDVVMYVDIRRRQKASSFPSNSGCWHPSDSIFSECGRSDLDHPSFRGQAV